MIDSTSVNGHTTDLILIKIPGRRTCAFSWRVLVELENSPQMTHQIYWCFSTIFFLFYMFLNA